MPQPLYNRGNSLQYPLDKRLDGPRAGLNAVEKRSLLPLREIDSSPPLAFFGRSARSLITVLTELHYKGQPIHMSAKFELRLRFS
jgi:hypothetical protein